MLSKVSYNAYNSSTKNIQNSYQSVNFGSNRIPSKVKLPKPPSKTRGAIPKTTSPSRHSYSTEGSIPVAIDPEHDNYFYIPAHTNSDLDSFEYCGD